MANHLIKCFATVALMVSLGAANSVYAQQKKSFNPKAPRAYAFGIVDTGNRIKTTYDKILSTPTLMCSGKDCEVTEFTISFLPGGKDYFGPFVVKGDALSKANKDFLAELRLNKNPETKIFLESITIKHDGIEEKTRPIIITCTM